MPAANAKMSEHGARTEGVAPSASARMKKREGEKKRAEREMERQLLSAVKRMPLKSIFAKLEEVAGCETTDHAWAGGRLLLGG